MTEGGMLSILQHGTTYQLRYASSNQHGMDHKPYLCPTEDILLALLQHWGLDAWSMQQTQAELRHGRLAVLPLVCRRGQMHVYFPPTLPTS